MTARPGPRTAGSERRRGLSQDDLAAWSAYTATATPLARRSGQADAKPPGAVAPPVGAAAASPAPEGPPRPTPATPERRRATSPPAAGVADARPGDLDPATWTRLRAGKLTRRQRLDLHGHTANAARARLEIFLEQAHRDGVRVVEVITGRGDGTRTGVIRREMPHWLDLPPIRRLIRAATYPNVGAIRLLLRRR